MSVLKVKMAALRRAPEGSFTLTSKEWIEGLRSQQGRIDDPEGVFCSLSLDLDDPRVTVTGRVRGAMTLQCSRCLSEFESPLAVEIKEVFRPEGDEEEFLGYAIEDGTLDLEPMLRDAILLCFPTYPLHAPDCKGLCAVCGADRNSVDCGHDSSAPSGVWSQLESVREAINRQSKE